MHIYLIRHGQDTDNALGLLNGRRDNDLTKLGVEQIKQATKQLQDKQISVILTSPLKRTVQTAQIINQQLKANQLLINNDLIERDFGGLAGHPESDIAQFTNNVIITSENIYMLDGPGVESFLSVYQRAKNVIQLAQTQYAQNNVLLVAHNDIGKMLQAVVNQQTWEQALQTPVIQNGEIVKLI
ncbi:histidine phosphatase family protein [Patescibacteria group bacterium]|nr:histidine phosphatase family protein [Patescibacteria group bacterium]MCL5410085.1 histidine phosphatase family protein [Patescibacteria group bacterium]